MNRFGYEANTNSHNNATYPFVVFDYGDPDESGGQFGGRTPIAYTVTQHTAQEYVRQLNENGYIATV